MLPLPDRSELRRRLPRLYLGLLAFGLGIAALVRGELGLNPWDTFHQGISDRVDVPIGTVGIFVGLALLVLWIPLRQRLGIGTISNVILVGLVIDGTLLVVPEVEALVPRIAYLGGGILLLALGSGLYIGAGLGPGPRDGLMTGIAARRGWSIRSVRTGIELTVLALGWALGGTVGIGTLLQAVTIGPLVQLFLGLLSVPDVAPSAARPASSRGSSADEVGTMPFGGATGGGAPRAQ